MWLDVLENSQGEEPFISQAWAITEACSHRHNHLLELLENGSTKWCGLRVHHSVQGNFFKCHSNKSLFSVLAEPSWDKRFAPGCPLGKDLIFIFCCLFAAWKTVPIPVIYSSYSLASQQHEGRDFSQIIQDSCCGVSWCHYGLKQIEIGAGKV